MLESLSDLHDAGVVNGDARYRNVVVRTEMNGITQYRWIDFSSEKVSNSIDIENDIVTFFKSIRRTNMSVPQVKIYADRTHGHDWLNRKERVTAVRALYLNA